MRFGSKGSMSSMGSKGWGFRKVGAGFSYFLFLVSYSLFPCVFAPFRALRETKKVQEVGNSRLTMLVFSPIIKGGEKMSYILTLQKVGTEWATKNPGYITQPRFFIFLSFEFLDFRFGNG